MINYIFLGLISSLILGLTYYTFFLLVKSGGSLLYKRVGGLGFLFILISSLSFFIILKETADLFLLSYNFRLYSIVAQVLLTYNIFKIWEIRHNQIAKTKFKSVMIVLTLANLLLIALSELGIMTIVDKEVINNLPYIVNIVLLISTSSLFLRFNKTSSSSEFRFFPILIILLAFINMFKIFFNLALIDQLGYFSLLTAQSATFLIIIYLCISDFKKSFYYYKKI